MLQPIMRRAGLAAVFLAVFGLLACGPGEPQQRKAFSEFLHKRIVDKPGIHVPRLSDEEAASFGEYARHYAVIADFNAALDREVSGPLQRALAKGTPHSLQQALERRADIAAIAAGMAQIGAALRKQLAVADAAHAQLKQPDDLKPVFDAAYDRDVTQPAKLMAEVVPDAVETMNAAVALADFIDAHRNAVTVHGSMIETSDPALRSQLQARIEAMRAKADAINRARQRFADLQHGT